MWFIFKLISSIVIITIFKEFLNKKGNILNKNRHIVSWISILIGCPSGSMVEH